MIIDYQNEKEFALENGVKPENNIGETWFEGEEECKGITFKKFFHLCVDDIVFEDCVFENCHQITFDGCQMTGCTFKNVDEIEGVRTDFNECNFNKCCSDGPFLTIDSHGCVEDCVFDTITALNEQGYIIYSVYGKRKEVEIISGCKFVDCQVESEDGKYCSCKYFKPFSYYKTISADNVDYDTCEGVV